MLEAMNLQPRTPGGENDNEDAVFGRRKALARTPPPSAPPASNGTSVFNFGADGNDVQKSHSDPLDMLKCLGIRARELVKRMNDKRHIDIPMKELAMKVVALQALVLKNLEKDQCSSTGVTSTGTQTSPGPANSGAKRLRESPQVSTRNSPPKKQKGARQKQPTNLINIPDQGNDESTPTVTVDRSATPAAKKQLQWQQVGPKAIKKKAQREPRPDAIIIQPQENLSYSDILRLVTRRQDNKLKEVGDNVSRIRKTMKGELLLELNGASKNNTNISNALGLQSGIRTVTQESCLEIRDLDSLATKEDIVAAIAAETGVPCVDTESVKSLRQSFAGTQLAIVCLNPALAKALLQVGKLKIGWTRCQVRERISQRRCYRCLEFGHLANRCTSTVDRTGLCLRCGVNGHKAASCSSEPKCFHCMENNRQDCNHFAGSKRCPSSNSGASKIFQQ
ncbi:hypothetical protein ACLKA6_005690 [Drosophila palustris]